MKQKKDIGEIYKNLFSEEEILPDTNLWEQVEFKTEKIKFYRFSLSHFNIYYLSAIVLFSLLSIYSFVEVTSFINNHPEAAQTSLVHSPFSQDEQDMLEPTNNSSTSLKDSIFDSQGGKSKIKNNGLNRKDDKMNKINRTNDSLKVKTEIKNLNQILPAVTKTDSIKIHNKITPSSQTVIKKEPKRRVVYIEQPDTIIVIDTLKGKEARKKRNK